MKVETNSNVDLYNILQLHYTSSDQDVRRSYRKLALQYHPDRNPGREEHYKVLFQQLNDAYETLTNTARRADYDKLKRSKHFPHAPPPKATKKKPKKPKEPPQQTHTHPASRQGHRDTEPKFGTQSWFKHGTNERANQKPSFSAYYEKFRQEQEEADQKFAQAKKDWGRRFPRGDPVKPEGRQPEDASRQHSQGSPKKEPTFSWTGSSYAGGTSASRPYADASGHPRFRWTDSSKYWAPQEEELPNNDQTTPQPNPPRPEIRKKSTARLPKQDSESNRFRFAVPRPPTSPTRLKPSWQNPLYDQGTPLWGPQPNQPSQFGGKANKDDDVVEISESDFFNARREARTPQPSAPMSDQSSTQPSQRQTDNDSSRDSAGWQAFVDAMDALNSAESRRPEPPTAQSANQHSNGSTSYPPKAFEHNFEQTDFFKFEPTRKETAQRPSPRRGHGHGSTNDTPPQAPEAMDMDPTTPPPSHPTQPDDNFSFSAFAAEYPLHNQLNDFSDLRKAANEMSVQGLRDRILSALEALETPLVPEVRGQSSLIGYRICMTAFLRSYDEVLLDVLKYMHQVHALQAQFHQSLRTDGDRVQAILEQSVDAQRVRVEWSRVEQKRIMALQAFQEYYKGLEESSRL